MREWRRWYTIVCKIMNTNYLFLIRQIMNILTKAIRNTIPFTGIFSSVQRISLYENIIKQSSTVGKHILNYVRTYTTTKVYHRNLERSISRKDKMKSLQRNHLVHLLLFSLMLSHSCWIWIQIWQWRKSYRGENNFPTFMVC